VSVVGVFVRAVATATPEPVSFRREVMAVLSKNGCASGPCHGNRNGKGGFKLSLRGEDPAADYAVLVQGLAGRRLNFDEPDQSLLLLKPATDVAHEGGARLVKGGPDYTLLRRWIAARAPDDAGSPRLVRIEATPRERFLLEPEDHQQLHVDAVFADGRRRDVTTLASYEVAQIGVAELTGNGRVKRRTEGETTVLVRYLDQQAGVRLAFVPRNPAYRPGAFPAPANAVDVAVFAKLRQLRLNPSAPCSDSVFLRRASLDLLGILPTEAEARAFVADPDPAKRSKRIDVLLERPEFAEFWALKWADLLRLDERTLDRKGARLFYDWLRESIATHKPLDQFARELVAARGSTYAQPAANYYRNLRTPVERAEAAAQVWLGTRLQCAQCHNHPYERWTQDDYHDWTAVFERVDFKVIENRRVDSNDSHEFKGEQIVFVKNSGEHQNPRSHRASVPRFLGAAKPVPPAGAGAPPEVGLPAGLSWPTNAVPGTTPLDALGVWLTSTNHPLFARTQANRVWYHLMGRGLVDPLDDFRSTNPASHPALLDALAADLVASGFDLRHLIRTVMRSRTYQLDSTPAPGAESDVANYSHTVVRRLTAEQLLDAQSQVTGVPLAFPGFPVGLRAGQMPQVATSRGGRTGELDGFLRAFGKPPRQTPSECERAGEPAMTQAFALINGTTLQRFLSARDNRIDAVIAAKDSPAGQIESLFWTALTRPPSVGEGESLTALVSAAGDRRAALEDVLWGLLNAKEFVLRK
jgi:hypothetical protein